MPALACRYAGRQAEALSADGGGGRGGGPGGGSTARLRQRQGPRAARATPSPRPGATTAPAAGPCGASRPIQPGPLAACPPGCRPASCPVAHTATARPCRRRGAAASRSAPSEIGLAHEEPARLPRGAATGRDDAQVTDPLHHRLPLDLDAACLALGIPQSPAQPQASCQRHRHCADATDDQPEQHPAEQGEPARAPPRRQDSGVGRCRGRWRPVNRGRWCRRRAGCWAGRRRWRCRSSPTPGSSGGSSRASTAAPAHCGTGGVGSKRSQPDALEVELGPGVGVGGRDRVDALVERAGQETDRHPRGDPAGPGQHDHAPWRTARSSRSWSEEVRDGVGPGGRPLASLTGPASSREYV